MNYASLRKHINALACLPAGGAPVISAYFDLATGAGRALARFGEWVGRSVSPHSHEILFTIE